MNAETRERVGYNMSLLAEACRFAVAREFVSYSSVQRKLRVGFVKATTLVLLMEDIGVVGPPDAKGKRPVLATAGDLPPLLEVEEKP